MGRRKKKAPKRGSLGYLPKARSSSWTGRIRYWPEVTGDPRLLAFLGYKAGMTHFITIDQLEGSLTFGKEISVPVTILETPPLIICGIKIYEKKNRNLRSIGEAWTANVPKEFGRLITIQKDVDEQESLKKIETQLDKVSEVRVIAGTQPRLTSTGQKKPKLFEIKIGGGNSKDQFEHAKNLLGKELKSSQVLKEGNAVDVIAITKGKGIQGPVKRWGVKRLLHKSRKTVRGVGSIGGWTPNFVMYSVPRAGQMGFFQRTEFNKQIVKIGEDPKEVSPSSGFLNYGNVKSQYVMIKGSIPGASRRLVIMRAPARVKRIEPPPKIEYLSLESKQGD
ncbi:MAG: 50S ribosomal protein L3 [Candidatus Bathyarchaeia archaeon]